MVNLNLFDDILTAYTKILKNPAVVIVFLLCFFEMVDIYKHINPTLFAKLISILEDAQSHPVTPLSKVLAAALLWFVKIVNNNKLLIIPQVFVWIPYFIKETNSNMLFTAIFSVVTLILSSWSLLQTFIYGQFWYLFTEMDNVWNKVIVAVSVVLTFIYEPLSLTDGSELHNSLKSMLLSIPDIKYVNSTR